MKEYQKPIAEIIKLFPEDKLMDGEYVGSSEWGVEDGDGWE